MQPTIAVPHATSCCIPPPHKLLIFKDFSESLSYIYIKAKVISKIVALIQHNQKNKMRKKRQTFQLLYKTAPHFSRWSKRGDKRRYAPCRPPRGGGRTAPPVLRFSPAMRAAMLAPSTPSGACSPPPSGRFPPLVGMRRVGLRCVIQRGQAREAGASGPEGKGARGACAQLWSPRPAGGGCPHLYGVGSKVVHTRARVFLLRIHQPP